MQKPIQIHLIWYSHSMGNGTNVKMKHDIDSLHCIYHGHRRWSLFLWIYAADLQHCNGYRMQRLNWPFNSIQFSESFASTTLIHNQFGEGWVACVFVSTIYANDTISYQPDIIFCSCVFFSMTKGLQANTIVMKFHFYLHEVPVVGNRQHSMLTHSIVLCFRVVAKYSHCTKSFNLIHSRYKFPGRYLQRSSSSHFPRNSHKDNKRTFYTCNSSEQTIHQKCKSFKHCPYVWSVHCSWHFQKFRFKSSEKFKGVMTYEHSNSNNHFDSAWTFATEGVWKLKMKEKQQVIATKWFVCAYSLIKSTTAIHFRCGVDKTRPKVMAKRVRSRQFDLLLFCYRHFLASKQKLLVATHWIMLVDISQGNIF